MNYLAKDGLGYLLVGGAVACIHYGYNDWILLLGAIMLVSGIKLTISVDKRE